MLAHDAIELVQRFHAQSEIMVDKEQFKKEFIRYVFHDYQQEVIAEYGADAFYDHLHDIQLSRCRVDFDSAVERWYNQQYEKYCDEGTFHDRLFGIVKEVVVKHRSTSKEQLVSSLTKFLTAPTGYMQKWMNDTKRTVGCYLQYVTRLGIRTYQDIEALVDVWMIENPGTFDENQQEQMSKRKSRGRPQNEELSKLIQYALEIKPHLTLQEKERVRKIYYYYRKTLDLLGMIEKFRNYLMAKAEAEQAEQLENSSTTIQVV